MSKSQKVRYSDEYNLIKKSNYLIHSTKTGKRYLSSVVACGPDWMCCTEHLLTLSPFISGDLIMTYHTDSTRTSSRIMKTNISEAFGTQTSTPKETSTWGSTRQSFHQDIQRAVQWRRAGMLWCSLTFKWRLKKGRIYTFNAFMICCCFHCIIKDAPWARRSMMADSEQLRIRRLNC